MTLTRTVQGCCHVEPRCACHGLPEKRCMSGLDLGAFRTTPLTREPFDFLVVPEFIKAPVRPAIHRDFPRIDSPGSFPVDTLTFGPGFRTLLEELRGPAFRAACEDKFGIDLSGRS